MIADFLAMGGYAAFVWPSYGISAIGLIAALAMTLSAYGRARARLAELEKNR
ncbi:MAG TPA: heme exporter protein CcmD [Rhizomicrobium sp.]|nr:heme exporter protein CcmD [Rhizomicrobium sp.]